MEHTVSVSGKAEQHSEIDKQQLIMASAQQMLSKMTEKCLKKCGNTPGAKYEERCVNQYIERYADKSMDIV